MLDQLSPYIKEGFTDPIMANLFSDMLKVPIINTQITRSRGSRGPKTNVITSNGSCVPLSNNNSTSSSSTPSLKTEVSSERIAFLKSLLIEQKKMADSLMDSSKKLNPISQKISALDTAYDAAFESDIVAPLPNISGTLQGFTIFFFFLSFISLSIVITIFTNQLSNNTGITLGVFAMFVVGFIVLLGVITRFG